MIKIERRKSIRTGEATSSNHTDSKSVKTETENQISESGRVEISKNISSEEITSWPSDRADDRKNVSFRCGVSKRDGSFHSSI